MSIFSRLFGIIKPKGETPVNSLALIRPTVIEGTASIDTDDVYISANPHKLHCSGWVTFEINSKKTAGMMDLVWGFVNENSPKIKAVEVWTKNVPHIKWREIKDCKSDNPDDCIESYIEYYDDFTPVTQDYIDEQTISIEKNDKWKSISLESSINKNEIYAFRCYFENNKKLLSPIEEYYFGFKPSNKTLSEANLEESLYILDPLLAGTTGDFECINRINNADFETGDPPANWVTFGAGATSSRNGVTVKTNTYSGLITRAAGANTQFYQNVSSYTQGASQASGVWAWTDAANASRLELADNAGTTQGAFHSGGSSFEWLTCTRVVDLAATFVRQRCKVDQNATSVYYDGLINIIAADLIPTGWTLNGGGAIGHYDWHTYAGDYSAALHRVGNDCYYEQAAIPCDPNTTYILECMVWAEVAARAYIYLDCDDAAPNQSAAHSGGSGWEKLTVEHTTGAIATVLNARLQVQNGNTVGYFDSASLDEKSVPAGGATVIAMIKGGLL